MRPILFLALAQAACSGTSSSTSCPLGASASEATFWQALAVELQACLFSQAAGDCREQIERKEWTLATTYMQELHGTIASGGSTYPSPGRAPEGDLCASHDDIDWNFNVTPDPASAGYLRDGNAIADVDHPSGVVEAEWEGMYIDPAYVARPSGASADFHDWGAPSVDMVVGDGVALRGGGILDCGHAPYRSEIHPPYLLLWGGVRGASTVVHVRGSARLTRPVDYAPLPDPPLASEALSASFVLPAPPTGCAGGAPTLAITTTVDWLYDSPTVVVDQPCDLVNGVSLTDLTGPTFDRALGSPAAHLTGTNDPGAAGAFFAVAAARDAGALRVTLTPVARPRQILYGAHVTASWMCP